MMRQGSWVAVVVAACGLLSACQPTSINGGAEPGVVEAEESSSEELAAPEAESSESSESSESVASTDDDAKTDDKDNDQDSDKNADADSDKASDDATSLDETAEQAAFFEDFSEAGSLEERFDFGIYHRDDFVVSQQSWEGDHPITGPNDLCGLPEEKRTIERGTRAEGFNDDWIYRCVPMGKPELAHIMTSIGDTSGYSIGAFSPKETFTDVVEVRWDVNLTDIGNRQFPEVKIMPADQLDFQDMPCAIEWLPCDTSTHADLGSVGVSFFNHEMFFNTGDGQGEQKASERWGGPFLNPDDPALDDIRERRTNFFRDNGDGTLTYGIEQQDGTFLEKSVDGSFPAGDVRVVFADHNYTPLKAEDGTPLTFSWHWDDLTVSTR